MTFIELYTILSNNEELNLLYIESSNNIFGNILFNSNNIELNITNYNKKGKIIGFIDCTENILSKGNYKLQIKSVSDDFVDYDISIIIDTFMENKIRIFIYYENENKNNHTFIDNFDQPEPWLIFCDSDKDDLYSLSVLIAQHYFKKIRIIGIVCDIGFFTTFIEAISMCYFWTHDIIGIDIPIYIGANRPVYLEKNIFPQIWTESYVTQMIKAFNYIPRIEYPPNTQIFDSLIIPLYHYNDNSIKIISTGPLTTVASCLIKYPWFGSKIKSCVSMIGNYEIQGNVPFFVDPNANSEYNAYMNPISLQIVTDLLQDKFQIVSLNCTNYIPLTITTANELSNYGDTLVPLEKDQFIINLYNNFIKLLYTTILTINSPLYMWDLCTTAIALNLNCQQKYIQQNFDITPTGTIITSTNTNNKSILYKFISYYLFKTEIINAIFANLE
jgi:inosine-uridine nucleoside N-ribohydrolase